MREIVVLLVSTALAVPSVPARAVDGPPGRACGFDVVSDLRDPSDDAQTGWVNGGPLAGSGTLTCTIQVNDGIHRTTANDTYAVSATGSSVVVLAAAPVSFRAAPNDWVVVCTQFTVDGGGTLYRSYDPGAGAYVWTTDPNSLCAQPPMCLCQEPIIDLTKVADPVVCGELAGQSAFADPDGAMYVGPGGDLYTGGVFVWDCPPYANP